MKDSDHRNDPLDAESEGFYDPETPEDDLWFLPGPGEDADLEGLDPIAAPLPRSRDTGSLIDGALWLAAQETLAADLAALAFDHGRLIERVARLGAGAVQRLALAEATSLSWWMGDRISADRLALWLAFRTGAGLDEAEGLLRTAWVARRLSATAAPSSAVFDVLAASVAPEDGIDPVLISEVAHVLSAAGPLHPVASAAALFQVWTGLEERPEKIAPLEAALLASRLGAGQGASNLPFLPLSLAGFSALTISGPPLRRLTAWISSCHSAVLACLLELDRLSAWQTKAMDAISDLSGRTPARLVESIASRPMLAAPQAQGDTGASRASVQRNLDLLAQRGLIREVTGQGRFRIWAAKL